MKLIKQIGLTLPILRRSQACEACGETFACEISLGKGCWCGEIKLSDETRQAREVQELFMPRVSGESSSRKLNIGGQSERA